jgi:hypothetical protein
MISTKQMLLNAGYGICCSAGRMEGFLDRRYPLGWVQKALMMTLAK